MCSSKPHAIAQVTTTAQLSQCLERVSDIELDGQTAGSTELDLPGQGSSHDSGARLPVSVWWAC